MKRATYAAPTLGLWPDEEDVELPLDELVDLTGALRNEQLGATALAADVLELELALRDVLAALEDPRASIPANRLRRYRTLAGRAPVVDEPATPEARRDEGIARAAARWTDEEVAAVDAAIRRVAERRVVEDGLGIASREFTTADVWQDLDGSVPITKGIAGRMTAAANAGLIVNAGRTVIAPRESTGPNHGQRLTVWRAL